MLFTRCQCANCIRERRATRLFLARCLSVLAVIALAALCLFLVGCRFMPVPQKGGSASVSGPPPAPVITGSVALPATSSAPGLPTATITQPDNPQGSSGQAVSFEQEQTTETPADTVEKTVTDYPDGRRVTIEKPVPAGTRTTNRVRQQVQQNIGGSWKDTARDMAAALGSFRWVQYLGAGALLLGAVAFFHPILRKVIGGKDTALAISGCGLVMIFGPFLFVKYADWFALALVAAALYWGVSRLKYKEGLLDANGDGIDDRLQ